MSYQTGLWPLGSEPVESLQVERLEAEEQRGLRIICSDCINHFDTTTKLKLYLKGHKQKKTPIPSPNLYIKVHYLLDAP
jgi:hypothetical protein